MKSLAQWLLIAAVTPPLLGGGLVVGLVRPDLAQRLWRSWTAFARWVFGITVECVDRNDGAYGSGACLFLQLNQTSLAESLVVPEALPRPFQVFANIEFILLPFVGWITLAQGAVVVVRQWRGQARRAIDRAAERMRNGACFYMSIEGRRSPDGALQPYKKGPAVLAIQSGATIVPIIMHGVREVLPYGAWRVRPGHVRIELCPMIRTGDLTYADRDALTAELRRVAESRGAFFAASP